MTDKPKGQFTFRFAAVCFALSALGELSGVSESTMLFGSAIGGAGAVGYHLVYVALFAWLAVGLWLARPSGYYTLLATTILYTVDRLQLVFVGHGLETLVRRQLETVAKDFAEITSALPAPGLNTQELPPLKDILAMVNVGEIVQTLTIAIFAVVLCWWGFVAWAHYRRAYFGIR